MRSGGSDAAASTTPAKAADPDSSSTSHGMAIMTIELPRPEQRFEACNRKSGSERVA
jgi:hypothetical protein